MNYQALGLNAQLQPISAIPAVNAGYVSGYEFDSLNERSSISGVKLRNFSFNAGTGGTIQLGGTNNQNGLLTVLDASGSTIVTINNSGITVEGGDVTIKNTGGTTILDGSGLTTANFVSASTVSLNNTRTTSSDTFVDVDNTTLSVPLTKSAKVLFMAYGDFANYVGDGETCSEYVALNIGGTLFPDSTNGFGNVFFLDDLSGDDVTNCLATWHGHYLASLAAGTHTAKLQFRQQGTHGTTEVDAGVSNTGLTYVILGS